MTHPELVHVKPMANGFNSWCRKCGTIGYQYDQAGLESWQRKHPENCKAEPEYRNRVRVVR